MLNIFRERLKATMDKADAKMTPLSLEAGMNRKGVATMLDDKSKRGPYLHAAKAVADRLGVSLAYLVGEIDTPNHVCTKEATDEPVLVQAVRIEVLYKEQEPNHLSVLCYCEDGDKQKTVALALERPQAAYLIRQLQQALSSGDGYFLSQESPFENPKQNTL